MATQATGFGRSRRRASLAAAVMLIGAAVGAAKLVGQDAQAPPMHQRERGPAGHGPREHGMGGPRQIEMLTRDLSLTPDQVTAVKAIEQDAHQQMDALREDTTVAGADKRTRGRAIHETAMGKVRTLLTDGQKTKFDAMQARMKEHMEERRNEGRDGRGPGEDAPAPHPPQ